jgi:4-amino-4-deoxy-L-arabinose transferase-like glycosyltransferase
MPQSFYQKMVVTLLVLMAVFFGFFHLKESPPLNADEGYFIQSSTNITVYGTEGLQMAPGVIDRLSDTNSAGYPLIYTLAAWFKLVGVGIMEGRVLMVMFLLGFVVLSYMLARRLYGNVIATAVLLLVATFPPLYGNGKAVMGEMPGMFLMVLSLFLIGMIHTRPLHKRRWLLLGSVVGGLFIATKVAFILFLPALVCAAIVEYRRGTLSGRDIAVSAAGVAVPVLILFALKFEPGDSVSSILSFYANPSNVSDLGSTIIRNTKALFTDVGPLYTVVMIMTWFVALVVRWRAKTRVASEEVIAFIFVVLNAVSFTRTAGFYRYLFPAQIISLIFFPYTLQTLFVVMKRWVNILRNPIVYRVCITILGIFGLYQLMFDSYVADSYGSHKLRDISAYFDSIPATTTVFFYNSEGLVPLFHGRNYYQYLMFFNQEDWTAGSEWLTVLSEGKVDMVVSGVRSERDEKAGVFDAYETVRTFDKVTIMKRK